jgi:putative ABC transport system ATP-binding protein
MIELYNIRKTYRMGETLVHALNGVSFSMGDREFVAVVGPSGSGKSTLMNVIGCLDTPDEGVYRLDGQNVTDYTEYELGLVRSRKIGFIFQQFNLLNKLTAYENVELPLIYQGLPSGDRRKRTVEALERVGLGDRMDHRPSQLSGGQQQRVAIARALAPRPSLILADEPTGNLDSKSGLEIMELLQSIYCDGNGLMLITHDSGIAARAGRVLHIADGKIEFESGGGAGA